MIGRQCDGHACVRSHVLGAVAADLIAADKHLDVLGGSAGAILALLRLYNVSRSDDVLRCATKCGEHLLAQARLGLRGRRS
jgi:lantibiotic modifying enzyme